MGQRGYCHHLYGVACLIRALVLRWTYEPGHLLKNREQGTKRKYLNTCRLQIFHYISNHFKWVVFANSRGICRLRTPTGKGRRGQRPTRAPRNSPRGTKEEHSLPHEPTRPQRRKQAVFWRGPFYFFFCWDRSDMLIPHKGGLARVSGPKHCPPPSFSSLPPNNFWTHQMWQQN